MVQQLDSNVDPVSQATSNVPVVGNQDLTIGSTSPTLIPNEVTVGTSLSPTTRTFSNVDSEIPSSQAKKGNEHVGNIHVMYNILSSYVNKLSHTSLNKANLWKLETNVPNDAEYEVLLPLASFYEVNDRMKNSLYGYFISKRLAFLVVYTKETIHVEYDWRPPLCSTCLIFGHSFDDCPKAHKRVVNKMDKVKGGSSGADDESFIKVKKKKPGGNNGGNKNFKPVSVNPKTQYRPKTMQTNDGANQKTTPSVGKNNLSTSSNGKSSNPLVEKINIFEKQLLKGKCVLVDDEGKPLEKVGYFGDQGSEDEVEYVDNKMASYLASKPSGVGYGTKSSSEQWRETYVNDEYDSYDDMYKGQEILDNIQSIYDNLDIKV
ncbi:hypothetical protein Tco_0189769 [Tanacetum coccineum]